jgi:hypothetical protein
MPVRGAHCGVQCRAHSGDFFVYDQSQAQVTAWKAEADDPPLEGLDQTLWSEKWTTKSTSN